MNIPAVLVSATLSFCLGGLWYSPAMFLKPWLKAMNAKDQSGAGHSNAAFIAAYVFAVIGAYMLADLLGPQPPLSDALALSLKVGLGFVATSFGINYQFAGRPLPALLIDGGYHVLQFLIAGVVLGLWH